MTPHQRLLSAAVGTSVLIVGLLERATESMSPDLLLLLLCVAAAVGVARWAPGTALGLAWLAGLLQVVGGLPIMVVELSLLFVLFAAARWGSRPVVTLAGLSILFVPLAVLVWYSAGVRIRGSLGYQVFAELVGIASVTTDGRPLVLALCSLGVPYLAGLALRNLNRAEVAAAREEEAVQARAAAEVQARQAQEIARLQEEQNRLARDVHDVVGHSLTVILAQAESGQYIDDPERLKRTMQTIADSARTSLQDVRQVLSPGQEARRHGSLDSLIEGVQAGGHKVVSTEVGTARPLPPELDSVAYRVLQEMLTNAIKHGSRDEPVFVERHWPEQDSTGAALRIVVRNTVAGAPNEAGSDGQGLVGMRRRLESVGGRLDVYRREELHGHTFTATALVPVRAPSAGVAA